MASTSSFSQADVGGGEVLVRVLDSGGAGDRERRGGAVQRPGQRDLLGRDVMLGGDGIDHGVELLTFRSARDRGGVPWREDDARVLGYLAHSRAEAYGDVVVEVTAAMSVMRFSA